MIKIAITGPIASGKSLVEQLFREEGIPVLDTDGVTHDLLENNPVVIRKVTNLFGTTDRKALAEVVFSDKQRLRQLENIIHPQVKRVMEGFFAENRGRQMVAVAVPLLYEAGMEDMFDFVVMVTADEETRLQRLVNTRKMTREEALKRIRIRNLPEKGDFVIKNNDTIEKLRITVQNILEYIRKTYDISDR